MVFDLSCEVNARYDYACHLTAGACFAVEVFGFSEFNLIIKKLLFNPLQLKPGMLYCNLEGRKYLIDVCCAGV